MTVIATQTEMTIRMTVGLALTGPELDEPIRGALGRLYPDAVRIQITDYHDAEGPDLDVTVFGHPQTKTGRKAKGRSSKVYDGNVATGLYQHPEPELASWNPPAWLVELVKGYLPDVEVVDGTDELAGSRIG